MTRPQSRTKERNSVPTASAPGGDGQGTGDAQGGGRHRAGHSGGGSVGALDVGRTEQGEPVDRPDDHRRLANDVVDADRAGVAGAPVGLGIPPPPPGGTPYPKPPPPHGHPPPPAGTPRRGFLDGWVPGGAARRRAPTPRGA